jgi:hypothetical protein
MGHHIHGAIGARAAIERLSAALGGRAHVVALEAGLFWYPLSDEALDALDDGGGPKLAIAEDAAFVHLVPGVAGAIAAASGDGLAYIETDYFGGVGDQRAACWIRGERVLANGLVNRALALLGVRASAGKDEWDTVGLGKHRRMPDD